MSSKREGLQWPLLIVAILGLSVVANVVLITSAVGDPSFSVEPNYYAKAVAWDDEMRQQRVNRELGWSADVSLVPRDGVTTLRVSARDAQGAPLRQLAIRYRAFHKARATQAFEGALAASSDAYSAELKSSRPGWWDVELELTRAGQRFTTRREVEAVMPAKGATP